jgi:S1-C subfamily serine protease
MRLSFVCTSIILASAVTARGDEALPAKVLDPLKAATTFIKLQGDGHLSSGSGFVVKVDETSAYIVTNQHVVATTKTVEESYTIMRGTRTITGKRTVTINVKNPRMTVVFHSGTSKEQSATAEVLAADEDCDLAVLKVAKNKDAPVLPFAKPAELRETIPVYVLGFPFGSALAIDKGNPAITIGKGAISSIRRKKNDELATVQIDGALNPGNSGGPVVDAQGRLVGVAVATIKGSNGIGFAVPVTDLEQFLSGRAGAPRFTNVTDKGKAGVKIEVPLIDPLGTIKSVTLAYVPKKALGNEPPATGIQSLPQAKSLELKIDKNHAIGQLALDVSKEELVCQVSYVNGSGKTQLSAALPLAPPAKETVAKDGPTGTSKPLPVEGTINPAFPDPSPLTLLDEQTVKHSGSITGVAFTPDNKMLATSANDLAFWELTGQEPKKLPAAKLNRVRSLAFSPDGALLAAGNWGNTANLLKLNDSELKELAVIKGHDYGPGCVAFHPDGKLLATGGDDGAIFIWDITGNKPKEVAAIKAGGAGVGVGVGALSYTPDGKTLVVATWGGATLTLYDMTGKEPKQTGQLKEKHNLALAVSPDGKMMARGLATTPSYSTRWKPTRSARKLWKAIRGRPPPWSSLPMESSSPHAARTANSSSGTWTAASNGFQSSDPRSLRA